jgi:hypothetical protein
MSAGRKNPDVDAVRFNRCRGIWEVTVDEAFEQHLETLAKNWTIEPLWYGCSFSMYRILLKAN